MIIPSDFLAPSIFFLLMRKVGDSGMMKQSKSVAAEIALAQKLTI